MELHIMYHKDYSALADLQEPRSVQYLLTADRVDDLVLYGIQITEVGSHGAENGVYFPLTDSRSEAERVLTYLYENAVSAALCVGVIHDLRPTLALHGGDQDGAPESEFEPDPALDCG